MARGWKINSQKVVLTNSGTLKYDKYLEINTVKEALAIPNSTFNDLVKNDKFISDLQEKGVDIAQYPKNKRKRMFVKK
jgi:hypothetical protein